MIDALKNAGSFVLKPLYWITSVILVGFHQVFGNVFGGESGWSWVLSIVGLTLVIRAALIPLFVKQIKSSRNMQLLQPQVKELQKKYGHDRERLSRETMALYKETGTNPFASCLPLILQMPIFIALFRLVDNASNEVAKGVLTQAQANSLAHATIFGAQISDSFTSTNLVSVRILAAVLVVAMTATTFLTQRQLMSKNMPADAMTGQYARQQKMLLYVLPLVFAFGGVAFPIGVLFYWTTSNLWTMGQQFYVIRNNPAPGTPAARAKAARDAERAARKGKPALDAPAATAEADPAATEKKQAPQRQQPKKQSRSKRKKQPPGQPKNQAPGQPKNAKPDADQNGSGTSKGKNKGNGARKDEDEDEQDAAGD